MAAILRATMPLLPTPVITSLALRSAQRSNNSSAPSTSSLLRRAAAAAIAAASSCKQRVSEDKRLKLWIIHSGSFRDLSRLVQLVIKGVCAGSGCALKERRAMA